MLVCYSGGKDSTYTLSILKKRYGLRILAFTLDNGFFAPRAHTNIQNVVETMGIDHLCFKPNFKILRKIFIHSMRKSLYPPKTLERASTICTSCMALVKYMSLKLAVEKEIPYIVFGWSPGQAPITSSILKINSSMIRGMERILKEPLKHIAGDGIDAYFLNERHYTKPDKFPTFIHPLAFFPYNEPNLLRSMKGLGWKKPAEVDYNATNCLLNSLADEVHIRKYGYHPYVLEIANFVREGYMTRAEGLRHIPFKKKPRTLRIVKKRLGIKEVLK